jgi:hypothetical protein
VYAPNSPASQRPGAPALRRSVYAPNSPASQAEFLLNISQHFFNNLRETGGG